MVERHKKSANSVNPYIIELYEYSKKFDYFVLGKPFGLPKLLEYLKLPDDIVNQGFLTPEINEKYNLGFTHIEQSIGLALGIADGLAMANPNKKVLCFISDSTLFKGQTLEAILHIGINKLSNLLLVVDYNKSQSRSDLPVFNFDKIFWNWCVNYIFDYSIKKFDKILLSNKMPNLWVMESFTWLKNDTN